MVELDLSRNNLSGTIPIDLDRLSVLKNLNLSYNNLEGEMPFKGGFSNRSVISIVGNKNLCGGIAELRLPTCPVPESKKQNNHLGSKVIIIIITVALCLVMLMFVVAIYWKRKPRKASSKTSLGEEFFRVSYDELLKATDGFASNNLLGVGSFSSVYKGILHHNQKPIAVKVFNLDQLGASKSFIAECEALRNTRHQNIVKIFTACSSINFEGNDFKALIFEFMQNGSLENWLHPSEYTIRKLNLTQRLNIAIDIVFALEYLHHHCETPIVHCDLKPSNVLLDEDMIAHMALPDKVIDIADSQLLILEEELNDQTNRSRGKGKMRECLISLVRIGVACSTETPNERMGISEIVMELNAIKRVFFGKRRRRMQLQLGVQGTSQLNNA
ncbi:hypothetical protein JRO89_XS14G0113300 [Xanthoceras sorbifolium]|uniref:Protein kinase domain-containing protein n=1 Tax=Xanthoceras sorbifolium TaxID=99658 RepID=A0ABQ8H4Y1_9ROSI|nr:hypothetical protein JRO89_XS14G0113300 [Xanthoceras sorbifolium]